MARRPEQLSPDDIAFLDERHLGTLTTLDPDGSPRVVAIAFTYVDGIVTIISSDSTQKVRNVERDSRVAVCQVDGRRWLTLAGEAAVHRDRESVADAVTRHERRYRPVSENPRRVAIRFAVDRILGHG